MEIYSQISAEIQSDYYQQNYANDGQRFVAWYVCNILKQNKNQTRYAVVDGANDKQIDAIVIDEDKQTLHVIQGKFIENGLLDAEPLREVLSAWIQFQDLARLQAVSNDKLKMKLSEVADALDNDYEVSFELITTASPTVAAQHDLETFQRKISENDELTATISLLDKKELERRYELAVCEDNPAINHTLQLTENKFLKLDLAGTQVVIAAIPLYEAAQIKGIRDGTLFQKNVRQSLGTSNAVNKKIRQTINSDKSKDFFFFHNGITAICNKMDLDGNALTLRGLSVVNGCQSLNTIKSCSETVKNLQDSFILFRFYEIPERDRADLISINTNSQSAVKPRDLRSNDKRILNIKKRFEQQYTQGYFKTKRGETEPPEKDKKYVIDLSDLGKLLMAWYSQRPMISYSETKIFDKYFEILFKNKEYSPENIQALNFWMQEIMRKWIADNNPLGLNETLLSMKAYAPYHHLYAISKFFSVDNKNESRVPMPHRTWEQASKNNYVEQLIKKAASCLNSALNTASKKSLPNGKIFSPQNWIKSLQCLSEIDAAISLHLEMLPTMDGGDRQYKRLHEVLSLNPEDFEYRLQAE